MTERPIPTLSAVEARVLGVLVEKQLTVPDTYPLTLNALATGCNQKTSREPVMSLTEGEIQDALEGLRRLSLVIESSGSRVMRYSHNVKRVLGVPTESVALLATLMLRGPQTAGELRANSERLQRFSDTSALEGFLDELAAWPAGALVARLARQPGAREQRWAHLLCGTPDAALAPADTGQTQAPSSSAPLPGGWRPVQAPADGAQSRIEALERRVADLEAALNRLCDELGVASAVSPPDADQVTQSS
ncbi:MAG TPA: YceH family protein [Quisquiliibacterium sp.]|nr:YceH family protein [Quisquiliibacterium sp.]